MRTLSFPFVLLLCACTSGPQHTLLVVAPDSEFDAPAFAEGKAMFTTIQNAINAASSGDTVTVLAGSYSEDITMRSG